MSRSRVEFQFRVLYFLTCLRLRSLCIIEHLKIRLSLLMIDILISHLIGWNQLSCLIRLNEAFVIRMVNWSSFPTWWSHSYFSIWKHAFILTQFFWWVVHAWLFTTFHHLLGWWSPRYFKYFLILVIRNTYYIHLLLTLLQFLLVILLSRWKWGTRGRR